MKLTTCYCDKWRVYCDNSCFKDKKEIILVSGDKLSFERKLSNCNALMTLLILDHKKFYQKFVFLNTVK